MLNKQIAIVTGGSRGIGKAIVELLLSEGVTTAAIAKSDESLKALKEELGDKGELSTFKCDLTSSDQVNEVINEIYNQYGKIDILVNNAGVGVWSTIEEMTEEDWDAQIDLNLKGVFLTSKAVFPHMKQGGGGQIVNIASDLAYNTSEKTGAYCASKWGLLGLTGSLNKEGVHFGIRVSTVSPGLVQTDFGGAPASKKTSGLTPKTVAGQVVSVLKTSKEAENIEVFVSHKTT